VFNLVAGLVIAVLKAAVVLAVYMGLRGSHVLLRATAMVAAFTLALLFTLGSLDNLTRPQAPAAMQVPQQLPALRPH
jgi:caa(3)-type oxidase subunit IV